METKCSITCIQEQGPRSYQEDRSFHKHIDGVDYTGKLLAVMDGHGGSATAELCANEIGQLFSPRSAKSVEEDLKGLVSLLNGKTINFLAGTTISIACVLEDHRKVSIAVLGDSPVVVFDDEGNLHVSPEHNVRSNLQERGAAQKRGGVYGSGYIWERDQEYGLQMGRALGDAHLGRIISHEPEIYTLNNPQWILVASDGLIDPCHEQSEGLFLEIKKYAQKRASAKDLMQWALSRGLRDNATAIVWMR